MLDAQAGRLPLLAVKKDMTDLPDDLRTLVRAPLRTPSPLQRYYPGYVRHVVHDDLVLIADGGTGPDFNCVAVLGPLSPAQVFTRADAFFAGTGYSVLIESEVAQPMEDALRAAGWHLDEEEPALVLTPIPVPLPAPLTNLTIRPVTTETGFADFIGVTKTPSRYVPSLAAATDPAVTLLVGYRDGAPVATARIACYGAVAEVTGVVTVPAIRRQGIGTAMTWAAIEESVRRGCTAITLTASTMGYPVYLRMGFVPVCTYRTYLPPASE